MACRFPPSASQAPHSRADGCCVQAGEAISKRRPAGGLVLLLLLGKDSLEEVHDDVRGAVSEDRVNRAMRQPDQVQARSSQRLTFNLVRPRDHQHLAAPPALTRLVAPLSALRRTRIPAQLAENRQSRGCSPRLAPSGWDHAGGCAGRALSPSDWVAE